MKEKNLEMLQTELHGDPGELPEDHNTDRHQKNSYSAQISVRPENSWGGLNQEPFMLNSDKAFPFILSLP